MSSKNEETPKTAKQANEYFRESTYIHPQNGQRYPMFYMNFNGFMLLTMGFTGKKALQFKLAYMEAFDKMRQVIAQWENEEWRAGRRLTKVKLRELTDTIYWLTPKPEIDKLTDEEIQELMAEVIPKSKFGFPVIGFKASVLNAGFQQGVLASKAGTASLAKTTARGAFHILGELAEIEGVPTIREDIARVKSGTDLRYRGEFKDWATTLTIKYNTGAISAEQITSLFNVGGFANGVGDWRPEKGGSYGTFHVATT